ncbi:phage tail protein, partial [Escherichia coli]|nr:phage tail protein [Escherichia coli]
MGISPVVKTGETARDRQILEGFKKVGLGEAAKRNVGTGENQIPDMASFASGDGWMKLPNGKILQYGRGA